MIQPWAASLAPLLLPLFSESLSLQMEPTGGTLVCRCGLLTLRRAVLAIERQHLELEEDARDGGALGSLSPSP
jgi:hypothetical protein